MIQGLESRLAELAARGETTTYGALARDLAVPGPGSIATLTFALEVLMAMDATAGRALRAALVAGRLTGGMPAEGFFAKAAALGFDASDRAGFVAAQRAALFEHKV